MRGRVVWVVDGETIPVQIGTRRARAGDIDGLDPALCPNTGTPVPGGLSFQEASYVMGAVAHSGRRIIGFDLVEVAPDAAGGEWDANVGARLLYKLIAWTLVSQAPGGATAMGRSRSPDATSPSTVVQKAGGSMKRTER